LNEAGIVRIGVPGAPMRIGNLASPVVLIAIFSFLVIVFLFLRRVPGAILLGILAASFVAFVSGIAPGPGAWIGIPPNPAPIMFRADLSAVLNFRFFGVLFQFSSLRRSTRWAPRSASPHARDFGNLPGIAKPMLCDALATVFAALVGTTTSGAFIESAAGVQAGERTGLTAVFIAALFIHIAVLRAARNRDTPAAYGPALVIIASMMMAPIAKIDFDDPTESIRPSR
jgi:AGZA family xanthine/uracil permease-like MFS transporter